MEKIVEAAGGCNSGTGVLDMDTEPLISATPICRTDQQRTEAGWDSMKFLTLRATSRSFARTIFESLAIRYASATVNLEKMLGRKLERIHQDRRRNAQQMPDRADGAAAT